MKRLLAIMTISVIAILSVFAQEQKYYFYRVDYEFNAVPFDKTKPNRSFKVNDWIMSPDFPDGTESMPYTIDGVKYDLPHNFLLISKDEYNQMLSGKKILNNQKAFLAAFEKYPEGQLDFWNGGPTGDKTAQAEGSSNDSKDKSPMGVRILYFLLLLIPVLAPIVLLVILVDKYEDRLAKDQGPSVIEPWMAIGLCVIETLILLIYGQFHVFTNPNLIPISTFWKVVLAIVLGFIVMKCMVAFNRTMLDLYGVKINILDGAKMVGIFFLAQIIVILFFTFIEQWINVSDTLTDCIFIITIIAWEVLYLIKIIRKQDSDALVIVLPMVIISVFGAAWLAVLFVFMLLTALTRDRSQATCWECRFCEDYSSTCLCTRHHKYVHPDDAACPDFEQDPNLATKRRR